VLGDLDTGIKKVKKKLQQCVKKPLSNTNIQEEHVMRYHLDKLEGQKNTYWKQRAHVEWLKNGDRNTRFFHACATQRRRSNRINRLKREDGTWVEDSDLQSYIAQQYKELFQTQGGHRLQEVIDRVQCRVTPSMNETLLSEYTEEEVLSALNGIEDLKAPRPDGMPAIFFKKLWDAVGTKVQSKVLAFLNGGAMLKGWNYTTIVLIPKVKQPSQLKDLRPISLCNVLYKIISKVLANRMKGFLDEIISLNQSAFVTGRLIIDNVLVAYEMTHYLFNKR
jgi:hypothetical protein